MASKIKKIAKILFNNDPLVLKVLGLGSDAVHTAHDVMSHEHGTTHKEHEEHGNEGHGHGEEHGHEAENPFLKLLHHLKENSHEFHERTQQSLEWYRKKLGDEVEGEYDPLQTYETRRRAALRFPGQLITFKYDPKTKDSLNYYDVYPLVLTLAVDSTGFLGMNFHYLRPIDRAIFMGALYKYQGIKNFQRVIKIRYEQLLNSETLRFYRPCIKRYLYKQMSPNMAIISPHLWDLALFLPTEHFKSTTNEEAFQKRKIWEHSRKLSRMKKNRKTKKKK